MPTISRVYYWQHRQVDRLPARPPNRSQPQSVHYSIRDCPANNLHAARPVYSAEAMARLPPTHPEYAPRLMIHQLPSVVLSTFRQIFFLAEAETRHPASNNLHCESWIAAW